MKKLLAAMLVLGSFSSFAMKIEYLDDHSFSDVADLIKNPSLGGVQISTKSDQNGVCKALGYQKAAVGTLIKGIDHTGPLVIVGKDGSITAGEEATPSRYSGYEIQHIICLNKLNSSPKELVVKVSSTPLDPHAGVPFSMKSDQDGVCRALGYQRAAVGSAIKGIDYTGPLVIVAKDGSITSGEEATPSRYSGFEIETLVCITKS